MQGIQDGLDKRLFASLEDEGLFVHWFNNGQE